MNKLALTLVLITSFCTAQTDTTKPVFRKNPQMRNCYQTIVADKKYTMHAAILCNDSLEIEGDTLAVIRLLLQKFSDLRESAYDVEYKYENAIELGVIFANSLPGTYKLPDNVKYMSYLRALRGVGYKIAQSETTKHK